MHAKYLETQEHIIRIPTHNVHFQKSCAESFCIVEARLQNGYITEIHQKFKVTNFMHPP